MDDYIESMHALIERDALKLQRLAIRATEILMEEIKRVDMFPDYREARVYNMKSVGVQGDGRSYHHPVEITVRCPKHRDGKDFDDDELNDFLGKLSTRITNEIKEINRVVYVTGTKEE